MTHPSDDWEIPDFGVGATAPPDLGVGATAPPDPGEGNRTPTCSVANPSGTVKATASIDGRVQHIELSATSKVTVSMTEAELAREILVVGKLAGTKARSELFTWLVDRTDATGQDVVATARLLRDDMGLPTPEQAAAAQAEAFGERYRDGHG